MSDRTQLKSQSTQLVLTLLLGPLGLLYSSLAAAVVLVLAACVLVKDFGGYGVLFAWLAAVVVGYLTVLHWNHRATAHPTSAETRQEAP